jgi:hypothetical protein
MTIVEGSNEYSLATKRTVPPAGAVTVRPGRSPPPQPATTSAKAARVRAGRLKASGYYAAP